MTIASTSLIAFLGFLKLVPLNLDYTNWNALICALRIKHVTHYIGIDNGTAQRYDEMYKRPEAPVPEYFGQDGKALTYRAQFDKYMIALRAWKEVRGLRKWKMATH